VQKVVEQTHVIRHVDPSAIPREIRDEPRWVCWRYELRNGKPTKVPYTPGGRAAKPNDSATWSNFEHCFEALSRDGFDGLGFMLGGGFVGVDLDHARNPETGEIADWAKKIIDRLRSYTEISPSGTGIHVICRGSLPAGRRRKGHIEMYAEKRYFTVTGDRINDYGIQDRTPELAELHAEIFSAPISGDADLTDEDRELIRRAMTAKNGENFRRLWQGQWQGEYPSHSEADLALCNLLAFWSRGDAERIDRLFRASGLYRPKWERADYREATIALAITRVQEHDLPGSERNRGACRPSGAGEVMLISLPLTDSGNGERLALRYGHEIRYCHPRKTWYIWTGRRWEEDRTGRLMDMAKAVARELCEAASGVPDPDRRRQIIQWGLRSESIERKRAMVASAQSEPGIPILPEQFDADPFLLNCLNGTIELRTGELRAHRREDYCTRLAPVVYDPNARCPLWERFLLEVCGGDRDLVEFLQRAVGYSLTGSTQEEKLFFVHGPAASGKSSFLEAIKATLGDYAKTADFETFVLRRDAGAVRNDIAELVGRRFVVGIEVDEGRRLAEGLVKLITGGDTVRARFLYQEAFEFVPQFKLWLAANDAPRIKHDDSGMWRRILCIPFEHVIAPNRRDPSVKARLKDTRESGPGILAWAVEGCLRWQEEGLDAPKLVRDATEQYRLKMDPLEDFIEDCCVLDPNAWTPAARLREVYERYCEEIGERHPLGRVDFASALASRGCVSERRHQGRGWSGIRLRKEGVTR
jgi:putative DNA primase/helicase